MCSALHFRVVGKFTQGPQPISAGRLVYVFLSLQTGWSQEQAPQMWDLIWSTACLSSELHFFEKYCQKLADFLVCFVCLLLFFN